ncbi:MAG: lipid-A-disaccharide synthase [candidate division NC10 bacterium]|nr:lipid-A-disaccharide synthase [candidate division NC10 bacterium]
MGDAWILLSAGEASGDLLGAELATELQRRAPELDLAGMGGDRMAAAGVALAVQAREVAVVGLTEVLARLPRIWRAYRLLAGMLRDPRPALLICIDFPEFNLRLARAAARVRVPVCYYVSPQIWAWRRGRIRTLRRLVRKMLVIFPFEEALYREAGVQVLFVGHPVLDRVKTVPPREVCRARLGLRDEARLVGLLPGSREAEVERHLPVMVGAAARIAQALPGTRFAVAVADTLHPEHVGALLPAAADPEIRLFAGDTYGVIRAADLVIAASGTATLEAGVLGTPLVVIYKVSGLTYLVGRLLIRVPFIGMVNLVAGRRVAPELIQGDATPDRIAAEALMLLRNPARLAAVRAELARLPGLLGEVGAAGRAAESVLACLSPARR